MEGTQSVVRRTEARERKPAGEVRERESATNRQAPHCFGLSGGDENDASVEKGEKHRMKKKTRRKQKGDGKKQMATTSERN